MIKRNLVLVLAIFIMAFVALEVKAEVFKTTDQVLNAAYSSTAKALKTTPAGAPTTVFKRTTVGPNTDSDTALTFGAPVNQWLFTNCNDTCPVFIGFDSAASTEIGLKVLPKTSITLNSKVTTIHAIAADTSEIEAIGAY